MIFRRQIVKRELPGDVAITLASPAQVQFAEVGYKGAPPYEPSVRVFLNQPERISLGIYNTTTLGHIAGRRTKVQRNLYSIAQLTYEDAKDLHKLLGDMLRKVGE